MISPEFLSALDKAPNPSYVLDEAAFVKNMEVLHSVQKLSGAYVLCALKGFSMWSTFPIMKKYLHGTTASSLNEARLCFEEFGQKAHSCFVVYLDEEMEEVLKISSHITFNSLNQYNQFKKYIPLHPEIKFAIRINPEYSSVEFEKYNPCMPGSRFGVLAKDLPENLPEGITGLHFHALCESDSTDLEAVLEKVESTFGHLLFQCSWVNMGGGHHITRDDYDRDLLVDLLRNFQENYKVQVIIEPGEAIGWRTGILKTRVEDVVENKGVNVALLNASFSAHMPDCLEMPYKPKVVGEVKNGIPYILGGNTCMSGDFVEGFHFSEKLKKGDVLIFEDMMHYTFVKNNTFNGVPLPAIASIKTTGELEVHKTFGYSDFKERLS